MNNTPTLKLKKFDMRRVQSDSVCMFIGKRNTGKSFCLRDLLYYHQDIPSGVVISATEEANNFYSKFVPPLFINYEYKEGTVKKFLNRQKKLKKKKMIEPKYSNIDNRAFLIFDDLGYASKIWAKQKEVREIFMNGRHYGIFFCITLQYALGIHPDLRSNIDYVFLMRENIVNNKKRLYENYAGVFPDLEQFSKVFDQCTENYGCLVIDNKCQSNKIEDMVYWYKAKDHPNFKLCDEKSWNYSKQRYAEDSYEPFSYKKKSKYEFDVKLI